MALNRDDALNNLNTRNLCVFLAQAVRLPFSAEKIYRTSMTIIKKKKGVVMKWEHSNIFLQSIFVFLNLWWQCFLIRDHNQKQTLFAAILVKRQYTILSQKDNASLLNQDYFKA